MSEMGCICTCARAHPFLYLANGWADYIQIWCVARDPLDNSFTQVRDGMQARGHMHTPFTYLANGLEDCVEIWCVARNSFDESYTSQMWSASACAHVHTPFARWCLGGRSFIADQGALLVLVLLTVNIHYSL